MKGMIYDMNYYLNRIVIKDLCVCFLELYKLYCDILIER